MLIPGLCAIRVCGHGVIRFVSKTRSEKQFIMVTTDRYSKSGRAKLTAPTMAKAVATISVDHLVSNVSIQTKVLADSDSQLTSKFLKLRVPTLAKRRWRLRSTTHKPLCKGRDTTQKSSPDSVIMQPSASKIGTVMWSRKHTRTMSRCGFLQR